MSTRQLENRIGYHIGLLSHRIQNEYNLKLANYDLTVAQSRVLYLLVTYGSQTQVELQKKLYIKGSTMNGIVESLLKKDLIQRVISEVDKRAKVVHITEEGKKIEAKLWEELDHLENTLMRGFNSEEKELLITWLKRIENNIQCEKPSK
ncbi:MarR family transcriptional regulator [Alkalihalophilus marmarensis]|jgi:DNA-binding MarR family transcriptional regulator|uniref:MarR family transcripitonal regulator n=1 Tax=Alkalihalophilus marmarensis DSM 21297 TaxID=1188261 RepID=U6SS65_9BACI|nr:MarR family transcriptional regulator [Alkalihalophilus marmarensis]ERN54448.1 MarR family transcripitonal regulator [Alkalihalophilus marmarensis DSM 21297]MCM3491604.1 MarR family transcriptional regulator [Alkalihalophilus marmarensis]